MSENKRKKERKMREKKYEKKMRKKNAKKKCETNVLVNCGMRWNCLVLGTENEGFWVGGNEWLWMSL